MKVLDSFQRERCTIYLFVTFFNTVTNILICGCSFFDLHLLSYFSFMHQPDVNYTEEMKLNFAEPIFSTRIVRYRWIWFFVPFPSLFFHILIILWSNVYKYHPSWWWKGVAIEVEPLITDHPKSKAIVVANENRTKSGGFRKEGWTHLPFGRESLQGTSKVRWVFSHLIQVLVIQITCMI